MEVEEEEEGDCKLICVLRDICVSDCSVWIVRERCDGESA